MPVFTEYIIRIVAISMASFHIYTSYFGTFYPYTQRSLPVMLALILTFLTIRARKDTSKDAPVPIYDWLLVALTIPAVGYITFNSDYLANRWPMTTTFAVTDLEMLFGVITTLLILEATRRLLGWLLVIVAVVGADTSTLINHLLLPPTPQTPTRDQALP